MQTYLTNHVTHPFAIFAEHVARSTSLLKPQSDLGAFSFGVGECSVNYSEKFGNLGDFSSEDSERWTTLSDWKCRASGRLDTMKCRVTRQIQKKPSISFQPQYPNSSTEHQQSNK